MHKNHLSSSPVGAGSPGKQLKKVGPQNINIIEKVEVAVPSIRPPHADRSPKTDGDDVTVRTGFVHFLRCESEAGLGDGLFASQRRCAVASPLQGPVRRFVRGKVAWRSPGRGHTVAVQGRCPVHRLLRLFGGDVGRALGALDAGRASSRLAVRHAVARMVRAGGLALFPLTSTSGRSVEERRP